jgi:LPS sulfotransferase NodH
MHSWTEYLSQARFDQPEFVGTPKIRLVLVALPRTGSNLLSDYLHQLGIGVPMEYYSPPAKRLLADRWNVLRGYTDALVSRRTVHRTTTDPASVFATKAINPVELNEARLQTMPTHLVGVDRFDRRAQSYSFARASKTGYFADVGDPDDRPRLIEPSAGEAREASAMLEKIRNAYRMMCPDLKLTVYYEALIEDPVATVNDVIDHLGLTRIAANQLPEPRLRKLPPVHV